MRRRVSVLCLFERKFFRRLQKKTLETKLICVFIVTLLCNTIYLTGFISEKDKQTSSRSEIESEKHISIKDFHKYNAHELIKIKIISKRFGSKFVFDIPPDIKTWAFKDIIINSLNLPRKKPIKSLGISVEFTYTLYSELPLKDKMTLREAGVKNGDFLLLKIDISISDPMVQKFEEVLSNMRKIVFMKPPKDWYERQRELSEKIDKRKQKLHDQYIKEGTGIEL